MNDTCINFHCPYHSQCRFFFEYLEELYDKMSTVFKTHYCCDSVYYRKCARYYFYHNGKDIYLPTDLFPNQEVRAHSLLEEKRIEKAKACQFSSNRD